MAKRADNLSRTLQHKSLSAADGQRVVSMTVETLKVIRGDEQLNIFWTKVTSKAGAINVGEPRLPRRRKLPCDLMIGCANETSRKRRRTSIVRNTFTMIVACIQDQFDQPGYTVLRTLESLLMKACTKGHCDEGEDMSFATCFTRTSTKNNFASNCSRWALTSMW